MASEIARDVLRAVREDALHQDREAMQQLFATIRGWDVTAMMRTIRVPVIIVGGDRDPIIPYSHTRELAAMIPTARLVTFPRMGHTFFAEHLPKFHTCLRSWLNDLVMKQAA
jgi:pimeloyl-ACP methyl ester carboxylesterase